LVNKKEEVLAKEKELAAMKQKFVNYQKITIKQQNIRLKTIKTNFTALSKEKAKRMEAEHIENLRSIRRKMEKEAANVPSISEVRDRATVRLDALSASSCKAVRKTTNIAEGRILNLHRQLQDVVRENAESKRMLEQGIAKHEERLKQLPARLNARSEALSELRRLFKSDMERRISSLERSHSVATKLELKKIGPGPIMMLNLIARDRHNLEQQLDQLMAETFPPRSSLSAAAAVKRKISSMEESETVTSEDNSALQEPTNKRVKPAKNVIELLNDDADNAADDKFVQDVDTGNDKEIEEEVDFGNDKIDISEELFDEDDLTILSDFSM